MNLLRHNLTVRTAALLLAGAALTTLAGCPASDGGYDPVRDLAAARQQNARLQAELEAARLTNRAQQERIDILAGLGDKRMDLLFTVKDISIGRYSSGINTDNKPGDDLIRVYLEPEDKEGSSLKAAGEVTVQLFDLAAPEGENLIGKCVYPVQEIGKHWNGFPSYHYRFECPWKQQPVHPDITVRVTFVDYLTGKTFSTQKVITVALPPLTQPATAPASGPATQSASQPATRPAGDR